MTCRLPLVPTTTTMPAASIFRSARFTPSTDNPVVSDNSCAVALGVSSSARHTNSADAPSDCISTDGTVRRLMPYRYGSAVNRSLCKLLPIHSSLCVSATVFTVIVVSHLRTATGTNFRSNLKPTSVFSIPITSASTNLVSCRRAVSWFTLAYAATCRKPGVNVKLWHSTAHCTSAASTLTLSAARRTPCSRR